MAAFVQTIAVVDKSGKAVSTSKHLVNVLKEARAAYRERKADIAADRKHEIKGRKKDRSLKGIEHEDHRSTTSSRKHSRSQWASDRDASRRRRSDDSERSLSRISAPVHRSSYDQQPKSHEGPTAGLARSQSAHGDDLALICAPPLPPRAMTSPPAPTIDMDLAYGDIPPPLPEAREEDLQELRGLVSVVKKLLEEADCLQYSASATIAMLQKNPEAMAAVALTLAEISNIVKKMAPGALTVLKGSSPAVFALLASPQFLIAGGVAVGITIVAFGGYKIIKKIRAKNTTERPEMDEMLVAEDVSSIDDWRRGISDTDIDTQSVGTSVEGEYITPLAALSKMNLGQDGSVAAGEGRASTVLSRSSSASEAGSDAVSSKRSSKAITRSKKQSKEKKVKRPSPLRMLMHG